MNTPWTGSCFSCKANHAMRATRGEATVNVSFCSKLFRHNYGEVARVVPYQDDNGARQCVRVDSGFDKPKLGGLLVLCACGALVELHKVKGVTRPAVKCNAKCEGAVSHECLCSCGGENHGRAHMH